MGFSSSAMRLAPAHVRFELARLNLAGRQLILRKQRTDACFMSGHDTLIVPTIAPFI
jgi:hypothetical protein